MGGRSAIVMCAGKAFLADNGPLLASALAYSTFFAMPSALLVVVGVFTLAAGRGTITSVMHHVAHVMPPQAASLLGSSLRNLDAHPAQGLVATVAGLVLAVWSTTGAMTAYMTAINLAYERKDARSFVRRRLVALAMVVVMGVAFVLVAVLLMFGPPVERFVSAHAGSAGGTVAWIWWIGQWPILLGGLLVAFATLLHLGPDVETRRWRLVTPGAFVAALIWIAVSGVFAFYSANFGSYNKAWGSLSAVIVMLTWLWLSATALLLGAEIDAEVERRAAVTAAQPVGRRPARPPLRTARPRRRVDRLAGQ
jgi:membrane protein